MNFFPTVQGDLLKELPSFNQTNFSKYATDSSCKSAVGICDVCFGLFLFDYFFLVPR